MVKYTVFEDKVMIDGLSYITYGIKASVIKDGRVHTVAKVGDISANQEAVDRLCDKCNSSGLSPAHLRDIAEDFLCEIYSLLS